MEKLSERTIDSLSSHFLQLAQPLWGAQSEIQKEVEAYFTVHPESAILALPFLEQGTKAQLQMLAAYTVLLGLLGITVKGTGETASENPEFIKKLFNDK